MCQCRILNIFNTVLGELGHYHSSETLLEVDCNDYTSLSIPNIVFMETMNPMTPMTFGGNWSWNFLDDLFTADSEFHILCLGEASKDLLSPWADNWDFSKTKLRNSRKREGNSEKLNSVCCPSLCSHKRLTRYILFQVLFRRADGIWTWSTFTFFDFPVKQAVSWGFSVL